MKKINFQRIHCCDLCREFVWKDYRASIEEYFKNYKNIDEHDSVSCRHGCWYILEDKFYDWSITPSSEDKGYCGP